MIKYLCRKVLNEETQEFEYFVKYITEANHLPRGDGYFFIHSNVAFDKPIINIENDVPVIIEDPAGIRTRQEKDLYDAMVIDVYAEMKKVFGTSSDVSAAAFAATWEAMIKRPASYVDPAIGLEDEAAVTAFAQGKISQSDAYGLYRMKRIAQYQYEKSLLGE